MPSILVKHTVRDFATWKQLFDAHAKTRQAAGCTGGTLFQDSTNPNEVTVVMNWDSLQKAQAFAQSADLKATMEKAGVISQPQVSFLNESSKFTA